MRPCIGQNYCYTIFVHQHRLMFTLVSVINVRSTDSGRDTALLVQIRWLRDSDPAYDSIVLGFGSLHAQIVANIVTRPDPSQHQYRSIANAGIENAAFSHLGHFCRYDPPAIALVDGPWSQKNVFLCCTAWQSRKPDDIMREL